MNPRIKELAIEARLITVDGITRYALDNEFEQRFAELIVRECADIANAGIDPNESHLIGDDIKEHFGVENVCN